MRDALRRRWLRAQATAASQFAAFIPHPAMADQRAVKLGRAMMNVGAMILFAAPLLTALTMFALTTVSVAAQGTTPTGQFFGQDEDSLGKIINAAFLAFAGLLLLGGASAIGYGCFCVWTNQPYIRQFIGGVLSFSFGALIAAGWAISRGRTPTMPASLGN
jgi:hypothetical protein